jgi:hypothetical protein
MKSLHRLAAAARSLLATSAGRAMTAPLSSQMLGTWALSEVYDQYENGTKDNPWGADVKGQLTYAQGGRFSLMIISAGRPPSNAGPRTPVGPALGYFGTCTVYDTIIVHHTERSTYPNWDGNERQLTTTIVGNTMAQTAPAIGPAGQSFVPHMNWVRAD